ncbi:MAG: protein phosphatase 2C domain-containing protein [Thermodesulfobacteriota bacterium]
MIKFLKKFLQKPSLLTDYAGKTDIGRVRTNNEDCFSVLEGKDIFIVADGMGGHKAGEIASRTAVEIMRRHYSRKVVDGMRGNKEETRHTMISSFELANKTIIDLASEDDDLEGMGCTMVMVFFDNNILHTCHVGDARCYRAGVNGLTQITNDHTTLMEMQRAASQEKAPPDPKQSRHVVTRVIGYPFPEPPEYHNIKLNEGDRILLCSDGLWSMLDDEKIYNTVIDSESPSALVEKLVDLANAAGGNDNITALTVFC